MLGFIAAIAEPTNRDLPLLANAPPSEAGAATLFPRREVRAPTRAIVGAQARAWARELHIG